MGGKTEKAIKRGNGRKRVRRGIGKKNKNKTKEGKKGGRRGGQSGKRKDRKLKREKLSLSVQVRGKMHGSMDPAVGKSRLGYSKIETNLINLSDSPRVPQDSKTQTL